MERYDGKSKKDDYRKYALIAAGVVLVIILYHVITWAAVSYTHLDVYKRQAGNAAGLFPGGAGQGRAVPQCLAAEGAAASLRPGPALGEQHPRHQSPCLLYTSAAWPRSFLACLES